MASAVGYGALSAAGFGPVGAAVGGALGGLLDQMWMSKLFASTRQPLRAMDIAMSHATDGTSATLIFGQYGRVPLHLTWTSRPWVVQSSGVDKRGIQAPDKWFVQAQWMAANNAIGEFDQLIAEGKRVYIKPTTQVDSYTDGTEAEMTIQGTILFPGSPAQTTVWNRIRIVNLQSSGSPVDAGLAAYLGELDEGGQMFLVFNGGTSYGPFTIESSRIVDAQGNAELSLGNNGIINPASAPWSSIFTLGASGPFGTVIASLNDGVVVGMTATPVEFDPKVFPDGAPSLELNVNGAIKSAIMSAALGADEVPKNRNRAYAVTSKFLLSSFGNRMPNMSAIVAGRAGFKQLDEIVDYITQDIAGMPSAEASVADVITDEIDGFQVYSPFEPADSIEKLSAVYGVLYREAAEGHSTNYGRFFMRPNREQVIYSNENGMSFDQFNARRPGEEFDELPIKKSRIDNNDRIRKVEVAFSNINDSWQRGVETEELEHIRLGKEVRLSLDDMVLTRAKARSVAREMLRESWDRTYQIEWTCSWEQAMLQEEDIVKFTDADGYAWTVIVDTIDEDADFFVTITGWAIAPEEIGAGLTSQSSTSDGDPRYDEGLPRPPVAYTPLIGYVVDVPPLADEHVGQPGVYVAASNIDPELAFEGAVVFVKRPSDQSWKAEATIEQAAVIGRATDALATVVSVDAYDTTNTVNVQLDGIGTLSTVTEAEVDDAVNLALLGGEVIGFRDATLEADGSYTLDHLSRGRMATEGEVGTHNDGDVFVLLSSLTWLPLAAEDIGTTIEIKMVPPGATLDQTPTISYAVSLPTCVPVPPAGVSAVDNGDGSLSVSWTYRSPYTVRFRSPAQAPVPAGETVLVEAWNGSISGSPDYSVSVAPAAGTATVTYPANEGLEGPTINVRLKQVSSVFGASSGATASLSASYVPVVDLEDTILGLEAGTDSGGEFLVTAGNQETRWVRAANYGSIDNDFGSVADAASSVYDYGNL